MYCVCNTQARIEQKRWKRGDKTTFPFSFSFGKCKKIAAICAQQKHRLLFGEKVLHAFYESRCAECDFLARFLPRESFPHQ